jgi:CheY-like chemotaxis protein
MHILLVEDSDTLANLFRVQLRQVGNHTLTVTSTKAQTLAVVEQEKIDMALIDMGRKAARIAGWRF